MKDLDLNKLDVFTLRLYANNEDKSQDLRIACFTELSKRDAAEAKKQQDAPPLNARDKIAQGLKDLAGDNNE